MSDLFKLTVVHQPQQAIKFLTCSDIDKKRGEINNRGGGKVKICATFLGNDESLCPQELKVLVSAFHRKYGTTNTYLPSRYAIQECGVVYKNINWQLFEKPMKRLNTKPIEFIYELKNAFIFAPYEDVKKELNKHLVFDTKYKAYLQRINEIPQDPIDVLKSESCNDKYKDSICLRFDIFSEVAGSNKVNYYTRVHSEDIYKGVAKFKINALCNTHIANDGTGIMFLLLNKQYASGTAFMNDKLCVKWNDKATSLTPFTDNKAVSLKMPKKEFEELVRHCSVWLQETRGGKNGLSTPSVEFYYVNVGYALQEQELKRKKFNDNNTNYGPGPQFDSGDPDQSLTIAEQNFAHYEREKANGNMSDSEFEARMQQSDYAYTQRHGNTLFHNAILLNKLSSFLAIRSVILNNYMANIRNDDNETLLHYACKHNKPQLIGALIKIGCPLDTPCLNTYRTALHTAIYKQHEECIKEFVSFLKAPQRYNVTLEAVGRFMLFSDSRGFTVAHAAALNAQLELLVQILMICDRMDIDMLRKPTLTLEFSLLDLAKLNGDDRMKNYLVDLLRDDEVEDDDSDDGHDDGPGSCRPMSEMLNLNLGLRSLA